MGKRKARKDDSDAGCLVFPPFLYLGPYAATASASFFTKHSITHVLSIGNRPRTTFPNVAYKRLPFDDDPSSPLEKICGQAFEFIESAVSFQNGQGRILVHCKAGMSRSPTVITAYLMNRQGMTFKQSLGLVIRARPAVSPNPGFVRQLKEMDLELFGEISLDVDEMPKSRAVKLALFDE